MFAISLYVYMYNSAIFCAEVFDNIFPLYRIRTHQCGFTAAFKSLIHVWIKDILSCRVFKQLKARRRCVAIVKYKYVSVSLIFEANVSYFPEVIPTSVFIHTSKS